MESDTIALAAAKPKKKFVATLESRRRDHRFYTGMALAMSAGVVAGFAKTYFAKSFFHTPAIPFWVHVHGAVFTAWFVFYVLQNLLAMNGKMAIHRNLGIVGLVLAIAVVCFGIAVTVRQIHQSRFFPFPDAYSDLAVSTAQMVLFGVFIGIGLWLRRDSEMHKRVILMSSQLFFFPAFGRIFQGLGPGTLLLALCFYFAGPVYDRITRGCVHRAYKWGVAALILTMPPFSVIASHLPLWRHFVDWAVL